MKKVKSINYFNQLRSETHIQAFEVEDITTRKTHVFIYDPFEKCVKCIDTSKNSNKSFVFKAEDGFQLKNYDKRTFENVYDYFVYLYKSATHIIDNKHNRNMFFIGWVDPRTLNPYEDDNINYYNHNSIDKKTFKKISEHLNDKMGIFIKKIIPRNYENLFIKNSYFAGGCLSALFGAYKDINDYDIFLKDTSVCKDMIDYFTQVYIDTAREYKIKNGLSVPYNRYYNILLTNNAISFIAKKNKDNLPIFQIILKDSGHPMDVISRFDFAHSMLAYDCESKFIYSSPHSIESCELKKIKYNSACPSNISSIGRILKFCKKGMTINKLQCGYILKKIYSQIKKGDIKEGDIISFLQDSYYDEIINEK